MARFFSNISNFFKWGKVVLPLKKIRYYPPQFIIRDPVVQSVKRAFKNGFEVAILVLNIKKHQHTLRYMDERDYYAFSKKLKTHIEQIVVREIPNEDLLVLHDHYGEGVSLLLKVDYDRHCMVEIERMMKHMLTEVENRTKQSFPSESFKFESGYMFIDKRYPSTKKAIDSAYQQATAMAEKKADSDFNQMMFSMKRIVSGKEISLLAQPIIDVDSGVVQAWEMLTRGPKGTPFESPLHLFSVARQTGFLYDLEMIVLEKTFEQIRLTQCRQAIFVNFTPLSLGNPSFIKDLKAVLYKYKHIPPSQITIELTERDSIEGIELLLEHIRILRNLGFQIAIDDTGSGYASLNTISTIMPDIIKIDRSVIQDIDKNSVKESMLKGLVLVAKETGSLVVAEGIENAGEASVLSRNKVDLAQGYFFARPGDLRKNLASS